MTLGQSQEMNTHVLLSTYQAACIYLFFMSQAAIVSQNPLFSLFPIEKSKFRNLTSAQIRSWSTQGHHLNKLWWAGVPDATYQVSWKSVQWFWRRRFLKGFLHIWAWRPSWSCDQHYVTEFSFSYTLKLTYKICSKWPASFWEKPVLIFIYKWPWARVKKWPWPTILT